MKTIVTSLFILSSQLMFGQSKLAQDQNPDYRVSQARYMEMADSINAWHGTTPQETYKAIDYLADKKEARELRRAYRQERLRYDYNYYPSYYSYYPYYYSRNNFLWNTLPWTLTLGYRHRYHW